MADHALQRDNLLLLCLGDAKRGIETFVSMARELAVISLSNKVILPLLRAVTIKYMNQFTINTCGISNINFLDCAIKRGVEAIIRHPKQIRLLWYSSSRAFHNTMSESMLMMNTHKRSPMLIEPIAWPSGTKKLGY